MGVSVHSKDTREREIEQINGMSNNIALSYLGAEPDISARISSFPALGKRRV